jgi:hypothetical protein
MTGRFSWPVAAVAPLAVGLVVLAGCTPRHNTTSFRDPDVPAGALRLVAFDGCDQAASALREAAKAAVGPYGFAEPAMVSGAANGTARDAAAPDAADAAGPAVPAPDGATSNPAEHSGTNTHEAGVDEPDLVKTDGRRIVTLSGSVLRVVDPAERRLTGSLDLAAEADGPTRLSPTYLLLAGDHALIIAGAGDLRGGAILDNGPGRPGPEPDAVVNTRLLLVDLTDNRPRLVGTNTIDGSYVDARLVGTTARVVVRSAPRLHFPYEQNRTDAQRLAANRAIIDRAAVDAWLPRYTIDSGGRHTTGRVDCASVTRPATYSGTAMLTVLTVNLTRDALDSGDPVTVLADGETVYSNGTSLYVSNDQRWRAMPTRPGQPAAQPEPRTELYKFDIAGTGRPRFAAAGTVPGWLLSQYSMSDWHGDLRVATTTGSPWNRAAPSQSSVRVLRQHGRTLGEVGRVDGLGKGERIYAVRFVGPVGYVVTFRQTDPLYVIDMRDPTRPSVAGELKITGYSAYLHPVDDTHLIGIGQEANAQGRVQGTQLSLFDVADPARPKRLAQYHVQFGHSEAEFDPHAFLYWPATRLLVVPLQVPGAVKAPAVPPTGGPTTAVPPTGGATSGALAVQVEDEGFTELGVISHPWSGERNPMIRRSLVVDSTLWTVSDAGLKANDLDSLAAQAWIPFS